MASRYNDITRCQNLSITDKNCAEQNRRGLSSNYYFIKSGLRITTVLDLLKALRKYLTHRMLTLNPTTENVMFTWLYVYK